MAATRQIDSSPSAIARAFVGRSRELETFDSMFAGRRQILTLAGEPGIGKTRPAEAFAERAEDRGALVLKPLARVVPGAQL
jgi:MoxR-like ATPase